MSIRGFELILGGLDLFLLGSGEGLLFRFLGLEVLEHGSKIALLE